MQLPEPNSQAERDDDEEVAQMAVAALNTASRRAIESGLPIIVREGDELVGIGPQGRKVLKKLPPRQLVVIRKQPAST